MWNSNFYGLHTFMFVQPSFCVYADAIKKDVRATRSMDDEYLKALDALFSNIPRLRVRKDSVNDMYSTLLLVITSPLHGNIQPIKLI